MTTIRLRARNDINGNPRRIYVVLASGSTIAAYDEGYNGPDAIIDDVHRTAYKGITIDVSVKEYNYWARITGP